MDRLVWCLGRFVGPIAAQPDRHSYSWPSCGGDRRDCHRHRRLRRQRHPCHRLCQPLLRRDIPANLWRSNDQRFGLRLRTPDGTAAYCSGPARAHAAGVASGGSRLGGSPALGAQRTLCPSNPCGDHRRRGGLGWHQDIASMVTALDRFRTCGLCYP